MTVLSWRGLTMGPGSPYKVVTISGLTESPDVRRTVSPRARRHGTFASSAYLGGRTIQGEILIVAPHPNEPVWSAFSAATAVDGVESFLEVAMPGLAGGAPVAIRATLVRQSLKNDLAYIHAGLGKAVLQWESEDPRVYAATETTLTTGIASSSGGRTYPRVYPLQYGGSASGGIVSAENVGEFGAPWVATITGPVVAPRIENVATGQTISIDGTLADGEVLTVESDLRSLILNGTTARNNWLRFGSDWFDVEPGVNQIRFAGASGSGSMTFTFRSAWI